MQLQLKIHKCNHFNNRMQHQTEEQCNNLKHYGHQTVLVDHMVVGQNNPFHSEADDRKWQQTSYISPRFHGPIKTESWQMHLHLFHVKTLVSFLLFTNMFWLYAVFFELVSLVKTRNSTVIACECIEISWIFASKTKK